MFIKGSDDVSPTISSLDVDGKENRRLANNMKHQTSTLPLSEPATEENQDDLISL